ncbi:MAG: 4-hydroxythreonine-4-phosphate dehydrogenase PdxA [Acidobacteria bacterium RIFCSPLOWO2_12_FULL_67_14b]|nr:MAG: 4-hydroxythreonine-4-phosphate dehydrogenase PdxA [Acidobacteria bacterium RIFCSPLOWO2_02_FULL_68_18]OFW38328.1 MAG: 4-hydroxythreonine-4-phosphate dehydrogenase PdxA [Acidobacteria bacterium RIFCSPLOWO2_12_FULL_67_14b]
MVLPRIALTVGDPAGIGPEIAAKAAADPSVRALCEPVIFAPFDGAQGRPPQSDDIRMGEVSAAAGRAAYETIVRAVEAAKRGEVDAIATAPINKLAFAQAGLPWKGHTDLLAELCGARRVAMMFHSPRLKVVLATVHVPLSAVPALITRETIDAVLSLTAESLPRFGIKAPRIAVAGLNPHAGEAGVLGPEDAAVLAPAVVAARARGIDAYGPLPADTVFVRASRGEFDCVVACYHDQGLIPVKLLSFGRAVNVTIGLPIIRTSVDHGTAFDIAGQGVADAGSMIAAVTLAAQLAKSRESSG